MERAPRRNASRRGKKETTLAALRAARQGQSRTDQWNDEEDDNVYDEVDEETYRRIVGERRQREDFVVDDDGLGYYDDGEEHFGELEDMHKPLPKKKKALGSAHDASAIKSAKKFKANSTDDDTELPSNQSQMWRFLGTGGTGHAASVAQSSALDSLESLIDSVGSTTRRQHHMLSRTPNHEPRRRLVSAVPESTTALARAQLPSSMPTSAVAPRTLYDGEPPPRLLDNDFAPDSPFYDDEDGQPSATFDKEHGPLHNDHAPTPKLEAASATDDALAKKKSRFSKEKHAALDASAATRKVLERQHHAEQLDQIEGAIPLVAEGVEEAAQLDIKEESETLNSTPQITAAKVLDVARWLRTEGSDGEETSYCLVYWLDATLEANGKVYIVGKVQLKNEDGPASYASCCIEVRNLERCMFVLPRERDGSEERYAMQDVYAELRSALSPAYVPATRPFKCKQVTRAYAFGDRAIPRDGATTYLKVKYDADLKPPSKRLCECGGRTFEKILGAGSSVLELFLLKRKLMGPSWLRILNPKESTCKLSHCALEIFVEDSKHVTVERNAPAPPPLTVSTLSIKTAVNPTTHVHEIVAAAILTNREVAIDQATEDDPAEDAELLWKPKSAQKRKRWTMLGIRPLGQDFLRNGLVTSVKLPRDFEMERKRRPSCMSEGVTCAPNERALVSCLLARLGAEDPDVLVGHNISGFELDVLISRALALKLGPRQWSKLGRLNRTKPPAKWKSQQTGRDTYSVQATAGRLVCDTYLSAKEHVRGATTFDLVSLARTQLDHELKSYAGIQPADVPRYLEAGAATCELVMHLATSARLVERLALRLNILPLSKQLTNISGNLMARTLKGHRAERIEYLLLHEFHRLKFIPPEKERRGYGDDDDDGVTTMASKGGKKRGRDAGSSGPSYAGGLVLDPKRGFYDTFILLMDFASLYPSIIQEYDICFTTLEDWTKYKEVDKDEKPKGKSSKKQKTQKKSELTASHAGLKCKEDNDLERAEDGDDDDDDDDEDERQVSGGDAEEQGELLPPLPERRSADPQGVLPKVLKSLIAKRREVKQLLKKEKDPAERRKYDIRQMALKLTANSMYGCLGFPSSRFFAKPLAALVTSLGRETLQATANVAQHELALEVIYGDTDSIMINTRSTDLAMVKELGAKVRKVVNKRYKMLELELDGIFKSMLLLKKKKYAALIVKENPSSGEITYERETKGLDLVRRDWCELSKRTGRYVLDRILSGESSEVVVADIHAYLEQLGEDARAGKIAIQDFVITKGLNKPVDKYPDSKSQPHLRVAKAMLKEGRPVNVGDHIPYIICEGKAKGPADRSYHPDVVTKALKRAAAASADPSVDIQSAPTPRSNKKGNSGPPIVTPASQRQPDEGEETTESGDIRIDIQWYLLQQIFPPISRLCEPIAATSAAVLASKLGLDARPFANAAALARQAIETEAASTFTPAAAMSDEERFGSCTQLELSCGECGLVCPLPLRPKPSADKGANEVQGRATQKPFDCPNCGAAWLGNKLPASCFSRVSTALALAIRRQLADYYEGWLLCDDPTCGARTRQLSCAGPGCTVPHCKGRFFPEASERAMYTQLKYFEALFDPDRFQPDLACSPEHTEVLTFLRDQVRAHIERSAYNYVQPSVFAIFLRK